MGFAGWIIRMLFIVLREKLQNALPWIQLLYKLVYISEIIFVDGLCIYFGIHVIHEDDKCIDLQLRINCLAIFLTFAIGTSFVLLNIHQWYEKQDAISFVKMNLKRGYDQKEYQHGVTAMTMFPDVFNVEGLFDFEEKPFLELFEVNDLKDVHDHCCVLCIEEVTQNNSESKNTLLKCKHVFHTNCILKWVKVKFVCPTCKQPQRDDLFRRFLALKENDSFKN